MSNCNGRCPNCYYKSHASIPAPKIKQADVAIVGSSPEAPEFIKKQPIAGIGQQVIEKLGAQVGLPKWEDLYLTTSFLCKTPPKSEPGEEAMSVCRPRVLKELAEVKPKVIIALGNTAMRMLTGNSKLKITQEQGRVLKSSYPELLDIPILPTFHPGKVLRDPGAFKYMRQTFEYAAQIYKTGKVKDPGNPQYHLVDTEEKALAAIEHFLSGKFKRLVLDIETGGMSPRFSPILCVGVRFDYNQTAIFPESTMHHLAKLLYSIDLEFIWHNGKFDSSFLTALGVAERPIRKRLLYDCIEFEYDGIVDHDTMLMHYALLEDPGTHDLEQLAMLLLGAQPWEHIVHQYAGSDKSIGFSKVPREILYPYLGRDCDYTGQVFDVLYPQILADPHLNRLYHDLLLPASYCLQKVERVGVYIDREHVAKLREEYQTRYEEILKDIVAYARAYWDPEQYKIDMDAKSASADFKPTSPKQVKWMLYKKLGLPRPRNIKSATGADALAALQKMGFDNPIISGMAEMRSVRKMISTYFDGVEEKLDKDGRVHTSFLIHGTGTGRLSSRGPNLQNIPGKSEIRSIIAAPPGRILAEADYKAAELRTMAHLSGDHFLEIVYSEERDLHTEVTVALFGGPEGKDKDQQKQERLKAKTLNFGIPYGREAASIAIAFGVSNQEAQKMIDDWFARMPECAQFLKDQADAVARNELQITPLGRKKRVGLVSDQNLHNLQNEARNFKMQSTASDMTLLSAIEMQPKLEKMGSWVINLIHDATLAESVDDPIILYLTVKIQTETMKTVPDRILKTKIPFLTDFKIGSHWGWTTAVSLEMLEDAAVLGISPWDVIKEAKALEKEYGEDGIHTQYERKTDKRFNMTMEEVYDYYQAKYVKKVVQ